MNAKAKGTRCEHKTMEYLNSRGCYCIRSAASKGLWDVIAISPCDVRLIQVKAGRWPGSEEMHRMEQFRTPSNVIKEQYRFGVQEFFLMV